LLTELQKEKDDDNGFIADAQIVLIAELLDYIGFVLS